MNGVITIRSSNRCPECGDPLYAHDRKRVREAAGRWSYDYACNGGVNDE
jgi:uncharacterized protein with PIN domain